jgi:hypothetical protein
MTSLQEGIYLEEKKGRIGTGHTSSNVTYKNYYAVRQSGEMAELFLLDDQLALTGLKEKASQQSVVERMTHRPEHQVHFESLKAAMGPGTKPSPVPQKRAESKAPQTKPQAGPPQAKPAAAAPQVKQPAKVPAKKEQEEPWWESTRKGAKDLLKK